MFRQRAGGPSAAQAGPSKYGMLDRLWVGVADLRGAAWLMRRGKVTQVEEI